MTDLSVENYLSAPVRQSIEQTYFARVNEQARLENLIRTPLFLELSASNPAFFSDHGVVHVRDMASQILQYVPYSPVELKSLLVDHIA